MSSPSATHDNGQAADVLARQGLRLPQIVLKRLRDAGIYCQPTVSVEHQNLAKKICRSWSGIGRSRGGSGSVFEFRR